MDVAALANDLLAYVATLKIGVPAEVLRAFEELETRITCWADYAPPVLADGRASEDELLEDLAFFRDTADQIAAGWIGGGDPTQTSRDLQPELMPGPMPTSTERLRRRSWGPAFLLGGAGFLVGGPIGAAIGAGIGYRAGRGR